MSKSQVMKAHEAMIERFAQESGPEFSMGIDIGRAVVHYATQSLGWDALRERSDMLIHEGMVAAQGLVTSITPGVSFRTLQAARFGVETAITEATTYIERETVRI